MDLREESARFFFMERKKAPDAPCAGQPDSPDDSPHRRVDFSANGCGIAPSSIAHGAPPDMPRTVVQGQRRSEAGSVRTVISAPEQSCSCDGFKQMRTPPFRPAHRRKSGCPHRERLQRALLIYGQRRSEAKVTRIVSAPEQSCSSRRFQAEAHSPVPLCASPEKRVSAQRAAPAARSLYTANAARRAAQKPE